jgi:hypothetical protein
MKKENEERKNVTTKKWMTWIYLPACEEMHNFPEKKKEVCSLEKLVLKKLWERRERNNTMRDWSKKEI